MDSTTCWGEPRPIQQICFPNSLDLHHRETNSIACHGAPGVSNTAGAALWVIDYTLFASTIGISELYFHEGVGYKYNFVSVLFCCGLTTPLTDDPSCNL